MTQKTPTKKPPVNKRQARSLYLFEDTWMACRGLTKRHATESDVVLRALLNGWAVLSAPEQDQQFLKAIRDHAAAVAANVVGDGAPAQRKVRGGR